jgi:gamma-glutamyltranspeptidase / glutathione hydrolase
MDDLATYRVVERQPVSSHYKSFTFVGQNMPSSGGVTLGYMLSMLEGLGLGSGNLTFGSVQTLLAEFNAMAVAYADRGVSSVLFFPCSPPRLTVSPISKGVDGRC